MIFVQPCLRCPRTIPNSLLLAINRGLAVIALVAAVESAEATDLTCQIKASKTECSLSCMAQSYSHVCDDPTNTCRSTCGLYDNNKSGAEVLQGLSDVLPSKLSTYSKIKHSHGPFLEIMQGFQKLGNDLTPRRFSILIPTMKDGMFSDDIQFTREQLLQQSEAVGENSALLQFYQPTTVARIRSNASPQEMFDEAAAIVLKMSGDH